MCTWLRHFSGQAATAMIEATSRAGWRIYCNNYVLDEVVRVLAEYRLLPAILRPARAVTSCVAATSSKTRPPGIMSRQIQTITPS